MGCSSLGGSTQQKPRILDSNFYGVVYGDRRWIYFLDPSRGRGTWCWKDPKCSDADLPTVLNKGRVHK